MWGITPVLHRDKKAADWQKIEPEPSIALVGKTIYDGICEAFDENGDITDPSAAVFVRISRQGKTMTDTKYKVVGYGPTVREPKKLSKKLRSALIEALGVGGSCDLFNVFANMIRGNAEVQALLSGVKIEEDDDEEEIDDDEKDIDDDDEEEIEEDDDDDEEDDEDEVEEEEEEVEEKPKKKKKAKASKPKDDDDDEDVDLEELDAELDRISKKKKKIKA